LTEKGVAFETVNYLEKPLTATELKRLLRSGGLKPADVLRTNEAAYREFVAGKELSEDELIRVMAEHPEMIQRPIVVRGGKAVLARPAERLKDLDI
jgi:arsenate reductase (glutaredoxin)